MTSTTTSTERPTDPDFADLYPAGRWITVRVEGYAADGSPNRWSVNLDDQQVGPVYEFRADAWYEAELLAEQIAR